MKKIAFIDHSYHKKTKSSQFFIDFLQEQYQVDIIWDDTWETGGKLDLQEIDASYYAVIFWQNIYAYALQEIRKYCSNIIFIPMYDASIQAPPSYWLDICNVKILNFSRTMHEMTVKMGFTSFYMQYYPDYEIKMPVPKNTNEISAFFWNRRNELNWDIVKKLFENEPQIAKVHIHTAVDPGNTFQHPSRDDGQRFHITYSDWFATRHEYIDTFAEHDIYIAPRLTEGIGFSFLEAMSMGKAIVAVDAPTMNEYITDGENGYLFSLQNPKPIDFSNLFYVKENAAKSIKKGILDWQSQKKYVYRFIESKHTDQAQVDLSIFEQPVYKAATKRPFRTCLKDKLKKILPERVLYIWRKFKNSL